MFLSTIFNAILPKPSKVIGGDKPYLLRWHVIPRNRFLNIYLHKFVGDDDDRALHDHPWWFISIMLAGKYREYTECPQCTRMDCRSHVRRAPSLAFRRAEHRHRIVLFRNQHGEPSSAWTLVITGRLTRTWGFWCPRGFVPWFEFVDPHDTGAIGKGCD